MKAFISYSHSDTKQKDKLLTFLKPLERNGLIQCWHDYEIQAGSEIDAEIKKAMDEAYLFLLCISADAIFSKYIWGVEIKEAVRRHNNKTAIVVPIILRDCSWGAVESIANLKALPTDAVPVTSWNPHDRGYNDIAKGIERLLLQLKRGDL